MYAYRKSFIRSYSLSLCSYIVVMESIWYNTIYVLFYMDSVDYVSQLQKTLETAY